MRIGSVSGPGIGFGRRFSSGAVPCGRGTRNPQKTLWAQARSSAVDVQARGEGRKTPVRPPLAGFAPPYTAPQHTMS